MFSYKSLVITGIIGLFAMAGSWIAGCGIISTTGGGSSTNDVRPTGIVLKQGQFMGTGVSGVALIFFSSGTSYILRLEGLTAPTAANVVVRIFATPFGQVGQVTLRDTTGNQNYNFSVSQQGVTFQSVTLYSTATQQTLGTALLQ